MSRTPLCDRTVLDDLEVVDLLREEPELLAIADAIVATRPVERRQLRVARVLSLAAALAIALALVQLSPWERGEGGVTARALAAIGTRPVVHAVIEAHDPHSSLIEIATGRSVQTTIRVEYWFDDAQARLRSRQIRNGVVEREILQERDGGSTSDGPVLALPGSRPSLTPGLAAFVQGYRQALAEGGAREVGEGEVAGRKATWLEFPSGSGSERVAIDRKTSLPVLLRSVGPHGEPSTFTWRVLAIETVERRATDFRPPRQLPPAPYRGDVRESRSVPIGQAGLAGEPAFWLGNTFAGLRLASVERQELTRGYVAQLRRATERGQGIELVYGDLQRFVRVQQARAPEPAYRFPGGRSTWGGNPIPAQGFLAVVEAQDVASDEQDCFGQLRRGGTYVTIWSSDSGLCLAVARALEPIEGGVR